MITTTPLWANLLGILLFSILVCVVIGGAMAGFGDKDKP